MSFSGCRNTPEIQSSVLEEDFISTNLTTIEDIDTYVEDFDHSNYCEIYEEIKEKSFGTI